MGEKKGKKKKKNNQIKLVKKSVELMKRTRTYTHARTCKQLER